MFRKLKQGRYESEARLDLHRMNVARARRELFSFIEESHALGLRSVLLLSETPVALDETEVVDLTPRPDSGVAQ